VADIFTNPLGADTFHGLVDRFLSRGAGCHRNCAIGQDGRSGGWGPINSTEENGDRAPRVKATARGECERWDECSVHGAYRWVVVQGCEPLACGSCRARSAAILDPRFAGLNGGFRLWRGELLG